MVSVITSYTVVGVDAVRVRVEIDSSRGLPGMTIVGLPDSAVKESRERVRSAIINSGHTFPTKKVVVNLAPASLKKEGTLYDLPIAIGILACQGLVSTERLENLIVAGELGLKGEITRIPGILPAVELAKKENLDVMLPAENLEEALLVKGVNLYPVRNLVEAVSFLNGDLEIPPADPQRAEISYSYEVDMSDIAGQSQAKRALEISAAGHHNLFMIGPPGAGKTMLARRLPTILPPMTEEEIIETSKIYSVAGYLDEVPVTRRPFRSPHSSCSDVSLIGGGSTVKPGEVSLAHNGVLFLDEMPEFKRSALEALRQPLEDGFVVISRASGSYVFPARFSLVGASNPCPCGYYGFSNGTHHCNCSPYEVKKYRSKISGPILDRMDIFITVPPVPVEELQKGGGETSESIRERVIRAHEIQKRRFEGTGIRFNSQMGRKEIKKFCTMEPSAEELLKKGIRAFGLSARGYSRVLKLARTIADLEGSDEIKAKHIAEALSYRQQERD